MKIWKRNAVAATVLVLICAGVYLNWAAKQKPVQDITDTLNPEQVLNDATLVMAQEKDQAVAVSASAAAADSFAQIRLTRQEARDSAVELLQETMAYEEGTEAAASASSSLDHLVSDALAESQIESLIIAKGFADCVAYMNEEGISIAVSAPQDGLTQTDVALISDVVTTQTAYSLQDLRIIEVK